MPDYKTMYGKLFRAITNAITLLQEAQQETEELYISLEEPALTVLRNSDTDNEGESDETQSNK